MGSLPTFAAAAHEINAKSEGERRHCGTKRLLVVCKNLLQNITEQVHCFNVKKGSKKFRSYKKILFIQVRRVHLENTVAVIGLGAMGAALARAQLRAGHPTNVWNRSSSKVDSLVSEGAVGCETAGIAVETAQVVLVCVDTNTNAELALEDACGAGALKGRVVVQLGTTTPAEARSFSKKVRSSGGMALDGAIMCYPDSVGPNNDAPLLVGGDVDGFQIAKPYLRQISGNLVDLGKNEAAAAAVALGLLTTSVALYAGVAHAARICEAEGADIEILGKLCLHGPIAPKRFEIIAKEAFALNSLHDGGSLTVWSDVAENIREQAHTAGINSELPDFLSAFYRRAVKAGYGDEDVAALIKTLRS
jgi:3-hydroxyisobutyrate dehydrogenase-like beta-hydroxyacid dehydrogenase